MRSRAGGSGLGPGEHLGACCSLWRPVIPQHLDDRDTGLQTARWALKGSLAEITTPSSSPVPDLADKRGRDPAGRGHSGSPHRGSCDPTLSSKLCPRTCCGRRPGLVTCACYMRQNGRSLPEAEACLVVRERCMCSGADCLSELKPRCDQEWSKVKEGTKNVLTKLWIKTGF